MPVAEDAVEAVPAGTRGATRVADRVVAKIASYAAREALRDFPETAQRVPARSGAPQATVSVRRAAERGAVGSATGRLAALGEVRVRITVELGYPCDIGARCASVRRTVAKRVRALAGMDVDEIIVTVERLQSVHTQGSGQERVR